MTILEHGYNTMVHCIKMVELPVRPLSFAFVFPQWLLALFLVSLELRS